MRTPRLLGLALALVTTATLGACAADGSGRDDDFDVSEGELGTDDDEQSFSDYDATSDELAQAADETKMDNELTLFAIPAPKLTGLNWKRPGGLARRTLVSNALSLSRSLGHAAVRVQCGAHGSEPAGHFQSSMISTDDTFRTMVLKEKAGLGALLRTVPGSLEPEANLQKTLDERYANGRVTFIRFAITPEVCQGLLAYTHEYERLNLGKGYGLAPRPLYKEGAGCSAFSLAFLELANLDDARFRKEWAFDVNVPMSLIGGLDNPGNKVSVVELFFTTRGWAKEGEPQTRLMGWDPTKMYTSISTMAKTGLRDGSTKVEKRGRALGLVLDRRTVKPRAELANRTYWAGEPGAPHNPWGFGDP